MEKFVWVEERFIINQQRRRKRESPGKLEKKKSSLEDVSQGLLERVKVHD